MKRVARVDRMFSNVFLFFFPVDLYSPEDPPYPSEDHSEKMGGEK
jgi:hypothetical protein